MDRQARTGDTALVKSREMTGRSQTLPWWLGGEGIKTTENKIHWPRCVSGLFVEQFLCSMGAICRAITGALWLFNLL